MVIYARDSEQSMTIPVPSSVAGHVDITYGLESSSLQPPSGSSHSESFQISTVAGVTGYQPYMGIPRGEHGRFGIPDFKWLVGRYTIPVVDIRTVEGGSNLNRWMTAFIATTYDDNHNNLPITRLLGRKVSIWESTDSANWSDPNHSSWKIWFVGRITNVSLSDLLTYSLEVTDSFSEWNSEVFDGIPLTNLIHSSSFGSGIGWETTSPVGGVTEDIYSAYQTSGSNTALTVPKMAQNVSNFVFGNCQGVEAAHFYNATDGTPPSGSNHHWYHFTKGSGVDPSTLREITYSDGMAAFLTGTGDSREIAIVFNASKVLIGLFSIYKKMVTTDGKVQELYLDDLYQDSTYTPPLIGALYSTITPIYVGTYTLPGKMYIGPISPAAFIQDLCNGAYSKSILKKPGIPGDLTTIARQIPLVIDDEYNRLNGEYNCLFVRSAAGQLMTTIEEVLNSFGYGYAIEPSGSLPGTSTICPYSQLRLFRIRDDISTAGLITITDADVNTNTPPITEFILKPITNISSTSYQVNERAATVSGGTTTFNAPTEVKNIYNLIYQDGDVYKAVNETALDFNGMRVIKNYVEIGVQHADNLISRMGEFIMGKMNTRLTRFGWNPQLVTLSLKRSAAIDALRIGDAAIINVSTLPNSFTTRRGGNKIMQILGKSTSGVIATLRLIDVSSVIVSDPPSINPLSMRGAYEVVAGITGSSAPESKVEVGVACILSTDTPVATNNDSRWGAIVGGQIVFTTAHPSESVSVGIFPTNNRVYVRARTLYQGDIDKCIPSDWVYNNAQATPQYIQVPALAAPTDIAVSAISANQATITWVNTNTNCRIEVLVASPISGDYVSETILSAGSTTTQVVGLNLHASTEQKVGVRYLDIFGGYSPMAEIVFTATGAVETLPVPTMYVFYTGPIVPVEPPSPAGLGTVWHSANPGIECPSATGNLVLGWSYTGTPTITDRVDVDVIYNGAGWTSLVTDWPLSQNYMSQIYYRKQGSDSETFDVRVTYLTTVVTSGETTHSVNSTPCPAV